MYVAPFPFSPMTLYNKKEMKSKSNLLMMNKYVNTLFQNMSLSTIKNI